MKTDEEKRRRKVGRWLIQAGYANEHTLSDGKILSIAERITGVTPESLDHAVGLILLYNASCNILYNGKSSQNIDFYASKEWKMIRVDALVKYGRRCCLCGRGVDDVVTLHVDHIKPRSKYPNLSLDIDNLQILCEDCNIGKGARYKEDWREPSEGLNK